MQNVPPNGHAPWSTDDEQSTATPYRVIFVPGVGSARVIRTSPLCMVEVPLGAPEAAVLVLDEHAVAGAPAKLRAALDEANAPALVLIDPECPREQVARVVAAAGLIDAAQLADGADRAVPRSRLTGWPTWLMASTLLAGGPWSA